MNLVVKVIFVILAVVGVIAVFKVSWFWSALLLPMVLILAVDIASSFFRKKK